MPRRPPALAAVLALILALALQFPPHPGGFGAAALAPTNPAAPEAVPGELVVGFRPGADEAARDAVVTRRGGRTLRRIDGVNARLVRLPPNRSAAVEARGYAADPAVRFAEPNFVYRAALVPNDPEFGALWGLRNTGQPGADIGATAAWDVTTGSRDVVVGVVDTGIDYSHPDLAANVWRAPAGWSLKGCGAGTRGYRVIGGAASCDPLDDHDHGTHVAGTIGATGNNGAGVTGVNWTVGLMGLKFLDASGGGSLADAVAVLDYAIQAKRAGVNLRVLNASWGCPGCFSQALLDQINRAGAEGILVVAAAGNDGWNSDGAPYYPAGYSAPNLIAVAATDSGDNLAHFSNYGATSVHLGAPGDGIYSTVRGGYAYKSGTSMAAPHVAGAAALVLAAPGLQDLGSAQLKQRLLNCGAPLAGLAGRTLTGKRLDVARAIAGCPAPTFTLKLAAGAGGRVDAAPPGPSYPAGTEVQLTATPEAGSLFTGWTIDGAERNDPDDPERLNPLYLGIYRDLTVVANFVTPPREPRDPNRWYAQYFPNDRLDGVPQVEVNEPDEFIDHEWFGDSPGWGLPRDHFSTRFRRAVDFPCGTYRFDLIYDDGVRFYLDGALQYQDWTVGRRPVSLVVPLSAGAHELTVEHYENDGWATIRLSWERLGDCRPEVSLSPGSLTFGPQPVGGTSPAQTVVLTNRGAAPLSIASIVASGDFAQRNDCGASLPVGAGCKIAVTFAPTAAGDRPGTLTITDNAPGSPHTVALSGTAPAPAAPPPPPSTRAYGLSLAAGSGGSATGAGTYTAGAAATLTATPDPGYVFAGWTVDGRFAGWAGLLTLTMDADHAVKATFAPRPSFPDVPSSHPAAEAISQLAARGIIRGYADGRFGPADTTLRAQMAALIARAMGWDAEDRGNPFPDQGPVDADLWRNVGTLAYYNVARGYQDGTYRPTNTVLHAQVISFITRAMVAKGYWQQATVDDPALYPNVSFATGHRWDLLTYHKYAGPIPGTNPASAWGAWDRPATRGWFALAEWQALDGYWSVDRVP